MTTIERKWGKTTEDYIRRCNVSEIYAKPVSKVAKQYIWDEVWELVTPKVVR